MTGTETDSGNVSENERTNGTAENEMSTTINFKISAEPAGPGTTDERIPRMPKAGDIAIRGARAAMTVGLFLSLAKRGGR